ncbi:MAG TPA: class I SAM-dependent methyltransferase [Spirochaetota bacterium]|nr:class I SAM-dependent methyltransferase [Spirochaetota bacterium]HOM08826.1 class I SAM-dependent methyltransferase [Spirochaetota bacterium]HPP49384.1 class I SAM-dependent methyltransferase [Spirochaetota bacterium]
MQKHEHKGKSSSVYINAHELIAKLPITNGMHILDAGCGDGYFSIALSEKFPDSTIYAMDYNEQAIDNLNIVVKEKRLTNMQPMPGDITKDIPVKADAVIMINVLHGLVYNNEIDAAMKNTIQSLNDKGLLIIIDFYKREGIPGPSMDIKLSVDQATATLYQRGFKIVNILQAGQYHYAIVATKR